MSDENNAPIATRDDSSAPAPREARQKPARIRRGSRQTRYLAQSVILEEAGSPGLIRFAMLTNGLVVCAFIAWSFITKVEEVAIASGEVVPTGRVQMIQHLEGGIIAEILVDDGDVVDSKQVMLRLDPASARAELEQMRARQAGLLLKAERLRAFGAGRKPNFDIVGKEFAHLIEDQRSIYEVQVSGRENRRQVLLDQIEQRKAEQSLITKRESTVRNQLSLVNEELKMHKKLFKKGLSSKIRYLDAQRKVNQAKGEMNDTQSEKRRTAEALAESRARLAELETSLREEALSEMGGVTAELAQVCEGLNKLSDRVKRLDIVSPVRGIVKGLKAHTVGGVLGPGGIVLEIVPLDKELIVESRINTRDVGHISVGQPVTVKVVTYDFARYGGITGVLEEIFASTYVDDNGEPYYKGIVSLDRSYVAFDSEQNRVLPGMTVQADINTGTKTLFQYILKPVYSSISEAFRER